MRYNPYEMGLAVLKTLLQCVHEKTTVERKVFLGSGFHMTKGYRVIYDRGNDYRRNGGPLPQS